MSAVFVLTGRTFPGHPYFAKALGPGQLELFNLLKAYSLLDREVGYCQGISFIAGILLMHVSVVTSTNRHDMTIRS
jgi:TBC1 domain-containing protein 4